MRIDNVIDPKHSCDGFSLVPTWSEEPSPWPREESLGEKSHSAEPQLGVGEKSPSRKPSLDPLHKDLVARSDRSKENENENEQMVQSSRIPPLSNDLTAQC